MSDPWTWRRQVRRELRRALAYTGGNKTAAAVLLGVARETLYALLRRHGLSGAAIEPPGPLPIPLRILKRIAFEIALIHADGDDKTAASELGVNISTVERQRKGISDG